MTQVLLDDWARLRRFLALGDAGASYRAGPVGCTIDDGGLVLRCAEADGRRTVDLVVASAEQRRYGDRRPTIFALAVCCAAEDTATRTYALSMLSRVCRTGHDLFGFAADVRRFRGWGRGLRQAVAAWYLDRPADSLAYQLVTYQAGDGWTHRDLLRLAKPRPVRGSATDVALRWAVGKINRPWPTSTPALIRAYDAVSHSTSPGASAALVRRHRLALSTLPPPALDQPAVWQALVPHLGLGVLLQSLARMTANGALTAGSATTEAVLQRLTDLDGLRRAELHPLEVLSALMTYERGHGLLDRRRWEPIPEIGEALDLAFTGSFDAVRPSGARTLVALDISGSMGATDIPGLPGVTPRLASAAMVAVGLATEPALEVVAFSAGGRDAWRTPRTERRARMTDGVTPLAFGPRRALQDVLGRLEGLRFGATDCALPMRYALERGLAFDTFVVYTDSELSAGQVSPAAALASYRQRTGIAARLVVVGMSSSGFAVADPDDPGMLDVIGYDGSAPGIIADFGAGRLTG